MTKNISQERLLLVQLSVAIGALPLALGTQTAGSTRPISYCGVYGFKPTYGSIDKTGI